MWANVDEKTRLLIGKIEI